MPVRFSAGEVYQHHETMNDGRAGLLRIVGDTSSTGEWFLYDEQFKADWQFIGP
jgi:hypothetical protein